MFHCFHWLIQLVLAKVCQLQTKVESIILTIKDIRSLFHQLLKCVPPSLRTQDLFKGRINNPVPGILTDQVLVQVYRWIRPPA